MNLYCVEREARLGKHIVHNKDECPIPNARSYKILSYFNNCDEAVKEAERRRVENVAKCRDCC